MIAPDSLYFNIKKILQDIFGYSDFKPRQQEIITAILDGNHVLAQLPTGAGKSLCYQIPALISPGLTVVIAPLIALIHDQVEALRLNAVTALYLDSSLTYTERQNIYQRLTTEAVKLLYIAPERLTDPQFITFLRERQIARFVIDEAHCISQWGHDFRREYLNLTRLAQLFPHIPRVAFTATADAVTKQEILTTLAITAAKIFTDYSHRPNIRYYFVAKNNVKKQLLRFLQSRSREECGIVYCFSRRQTEDISTFLQNYGYRTFIYHAGLAAADKKYNQLTFNRAQAGIMVATVAFGLGIDKANIRFVARLNLPASIETFIQESGRAGRDGLPAVSWLCYGLNDYVLANERIKQSGLTPEQITVKLKKLGKMLYFCDSLNCRICTFYQYFQVEPQEHHCPQPPNASKYDAVVAVLQLLSAVYHTGQNAAISELIEIIRGQNPWLRSRYQLGNAKIYGIGARLPVKYWRTVIRQCLAYDLLEVTNSCQILRFTPEGIVFLQKKPLIYFRKDNYSPDYPPFYRAKTAREKDLLRALEKIREVWAAAYRLTPQYIVNDYTLEILTALKPQKTAELAKIPGLSKAKIARFGSEITALCRRYQTD